jgi:glycosyltransferase involved in cell wall biosynthesis
MKEKVAIIGTNGFPGNYGGWDQLVKHLIDDLEDEFSFLVYTSIFNAAKGITEYKGARLIIIRLKANGIQSIPYDIFSLFHASLFCDALFICGTSGCIALPIIQFFGKRTILNVDGLEWKRGKWPKPVKWFLKLSERIGVRFSDVVISDNKKIQEYLSDVYRIDSRLIEYGGDQVLKVPLRKETAANYQIEKDKYGFSVCRIEPENNVRMILEAFVALKKPTLIIVGNWEFSRFGRELRNQYRTYDNIKLLDPIYEQRELDELRGNCALYIHGHSVGGTNPSLVEAMNLGLCVIAHNTPYNVETTQGKAIYFDDREDLIRIVNEFNNNRIDTRRYQTMMREIAERRYRWDIISAKYADAFRNNNAFRDVRR